MINTRQLVAGGMLAVLFSLIFACSGQNDSGEQTGHSPGRDVQGAQGEPVMVFDTLIHDFGTIIEGESVVCYFDYRNEGKQDLVINDVVAGCGCTIPRWSKEPLEPGKNETLEIIFDASGRNGEQRKLVTVRSNASNQVVQLVIRARVTNSV